MECKAKNPTMGVKERCLVEDSFVEALDTQQRQPEAKSDLKADETKVPTAAGRVDGYDVHTAKQQDDLMESVKVFIRNIDIDKL